MIALIAFLAFAPVSTVETVAKVVPVPVTEFSVDNLAFVCLTEPQPDGTTANWVELGIDYDKGTGVVDYSAQLGGKRRFAVLKNAIQKVDGEPIPNGLRWKIQASGEFEGRLVKIDAVISRRGLGGLVADYKIREGNNQFVGTDCIQAPPRTVRGYDALLKARKGERG